ncbi:hypothetical protein V1524DRAFT_136894, partial [Lipomyces starkeyi]
IASLCGRRGSDAIVPISRTTMRLESHWRILKNPSLSLSHHFRVSSTRYPHTRVSRLGCLPSQLLEA